MSEESDQKTVYYSDRESVAEKTDSTDSNFSTDIAVPTFNTTPSYIRSVKRRGNVYMVADTEMVNGTDQMIMDLYTETLNMSLTANRKARILKFFDLLSNIFFIISGAVIGVLTLNGNNPSYLHVASILGFGITAVKTLMSMFSVEKRSIILKNVSNSLRKISRQIKHLTNSNIKQKDKMKKLEEYYTEIDEIDMIIFDNNATIVPRHKTADPTSSSGSSDGVRRRSTLPSKQRDQIIVEMSQR